MRNNPDDTFQCRVCGKDYLCRDHFVKEQRCCEDCSTITARDGRYIVHKEDIVEDTLTGLEWVVGKSYYDPKDRDRVIDWANSLSIGGGGWRLATCDELLGLYQIEAEHRSLTPSLQLSTCYVCARDGVFRIPDRNRPKESLQGASFYRALAVRAKAKII